MNTATRVMKSALMILAFLGTESALSTDQAISEAEKQLFMLNHLKNISVPSTLRYRFEKTGSLEQGFRDDAVVIVSPGAAGKGNVTKVNYLTGERNLKLPDIADAEGNPIIVFYLEKELLEMKRLTGGSANYYRKRIRLALVDEATVTPVTVKYNGKDIKANEIRISPYVHDPARSRYEKFAEKYYVFTLSDQIPGGVYQMRGVLAERDSGNGQKPGTLLEETLTFTGVGK